MVSSRNGTGTAERDQKKKMRSLESMTSTKIGTWGRKEHGIRSDADNLARAVQRDELVFVYRIRRARGGGVCLCEPVSSGSVFVHSEYDNESATPGSECSLVSENCAVVELEKRG